ncbi:hypothetical protein FHS96_004945 [Sphingomonas zeicaulis]|uniref:hypothetical protein n=1 Tax=Sphingomonas zeicaulis TaxID=1632740 RepID=UPI003D1F89B6
MTTATEAEVVGRRINDMAQHVGDQFHEILGRHMLLMPSGHEAIMVGVSACANLLCEVAAFGYREAIDNGQNATEIWKAIFQIFEETLPDFRGPTAAELGIVEGVQG